MSKSNKVKPQSIARWLQHVSLSDASVHAIIWMIFFTISLKFFLDYLPLIGLQFNTWRVVLFSIVYIGLFIPVPYGLLKLRNSISGNITFFILLVVAALLVSPIFTVVDYYFLPDPKPNWVFTLPHLMGRAPYIIILTLILLWINYRSKYYKALQTKEKLQRLRQEAELDRLKSQMSPHFLFNLLNNINSLIYSDRDLAADHVVRLSELLRYVIYQGRNQTVQLSEELKHLENYILLFREQKKQTTIEFNHQIHYDHRVIPLLFINFVENAMKYCPLQKNDFVRIELHSGQDYIHFYCSNTFEKTSKKQYSGIGLSNIEQRLEGHYNQGFSLSTASVDDVFNVRLRLDKLGTSHPENLNLK